MWPAKFGQNIIRRSSSFGINSWCVENFPECFLPYTETLQLIVVVKKCVVIYGNGYCRYDNQIVTHYGDVIMGVLVSQITSLTIVNSKKTDQRKHQSSTTLAFVRGIQRRPVNSPHKWPVTRKMFPFDDVIMNLGMINSIQVSFVVCRKYLCLFLSQRRPGVQRN